MRRRSSGRRGEAEASEEWRTIVWEKSLLQSAPILEAGGTSEDVADIKSHLSTRPHHMMNEREDATKEARQEQGNSGPMREYSMLLQMWLYVFLRIFKECVFGSSA